jgi:hypothetical protein
MHCAIETGGFEHELAALLGGHKASGTNGADSNGGANQNRIEPDGAATARDG